MCGSSHGETNSFTSEATTLPRPVGSLGLAETPSDTQHVDGRNLAPVDSWFIRLSHYSSHYMYIPLFIIKGFKASEVMQDFFHPTVCQ